MDVITVVDGTIVAVGVDAAIITVDAIAEAATI